MRVFDNYCYNLISIVKFNKTREYIEKMLEELGLSYRRIGFRLKCGDVDKLLTKYPSLNKYCRFDDESRDPSEYGNCTVTSISEEWYKGRLYTDEGDIPAIKEIFSRIPRPYNFAFADLMLDGIDWYGTGADAAIKPLPWKKMKCIPSVIYATGSSGIFLERSFGDGNKMNRLWVRVEATAQGEPRDTADIVGLLSPYIGKPLFKERRCFYSEEEYLHFSEIEKEFSEGLEGLFSEHVEEGKHSFADIMRDPMIKDLCGKRTIERIFKSNGTQANFENSGMPGAVTFFFCDRHRFWYSMLIDRSPLSNIISFRFSISSVNFSVYVSDKSFCLKTREEAAEKTGELARFVGYVRDNVSDKLAEAFGECPEWYREKAEL